MTGFARLVVGSAREVVGFSREVTGFARLGVGLSREVTGFARMVVGFSREVTCFARFRRLGEDVVWKQNEHKSVKNDYITGVHHELYFCVSASSTYETQHKRKVATKGQQTWVGEKQTLLQTANGIISRAVFGNDIFDGLGRDGNAT